ncbi:hypothetical protein, partial [Mesorhizobium sp.]|uniref:hypothetical protein n=1 Tax=Mesorhizobium sp. TaxID=1871066 RepID=UPI0025CC1DBA
CSIWSSMAAGLAAAAGEHDPLRHFALHISQGLCVLSDNMAFSNGLPTAIRENLLQQSSPAGRAAPTIRKDRDETT